METALQRCETHPFLRARTSSRFVPLFFRAASALAGSAGIAVDRSHAFCLSVDIRSLSGQSGVKWQADRPSHSLMTEGGPTATTPASQCAPSLGVLTGHGRLIRFWAPDRDE